MTEQTIFSLSEAAKITGKSKGTIHRALHDGRLSAKSRENNQYQIEAAELFRAFPETAQNAVLNAPVERSGTPNETGMERGETVDIMVLRERLSMIEELNDKERHMMLERIEELRRDRDDWKEQAARLAITRQQQPEQPLQAPQEARGGRFARAWAILAGKS